MKVDSSLRQLCEEQLRTVNNYRRGQRVMFDRSEFPAEWRPLSMTKIQSRAVPNDLRVVGRLSIFEANFEAEHVDIKE
jgi:hypothetical protein